jgi:hypothetical protein
VQGVCRFPSPESVTAGHFEASIIARLAVEHVLRMGGVAGSDEVQFDGRSARAEPDPVPTPAGRRATGERAIDNRSINGERIRSGLRA